MAISWRFQRPQTRVNKRGTLRCEAIICVHASATVLQLVSVCSCVLACLSVILARVNVGTQNDPENGSYDSSIAQVLSISHKLARGARSLASKLWLMGIRIDLPKRGCFDDFERGMLLVSKKKKKLFFQISKITTAPYARCPSDLAALRCCFAPRSECS